MSDHCKACGMPWIEHLGLQPTCQRLQDSLKAATGIEAEVCTDITRRQAGGVKNYGMTVADNPLPLRDWLQHAYEECLDQAVYLKRAMRELTPDAGAVARLRLPIGVQRLCDATDLLTEIYGDGLTMRENPKGWLEILPQNHLASADNRG